MSTLLYSLPLGTPRDRVVARQRTRQIAGLLGYENLDRALLAATVYEMARKTSTGALHFHLADHVFQVLAVAQPAAHPKKKRGQVDGSTEEAGPRMRLEKPLPKKELTLAVDDIPFAIEQLEQLTPFKVQEEIDQHNQDLLSLFAEWQKCRRELADLQKEGQPPLREAA